ncbi:hypothetical protein P3H15_51965 [Rhodococcus sp. T2V]|uniref:hypothetical protein n=1 Tax=Rhodococcus sp. T2V TaxID=3034164 RepID=UPI0023E13CEC|nr:hypothetical protein [Rhodococcus sp. T2V]MDF3313428.1 hypothetical protein [Rhodococcus sp. T2V]
MTSPASPRVRSTVALLASGLILFAGTLICVAAAVGVFGFGVLVAQIAVALLGSVGLIVAVTDLGDTDSEPGVHDPRLLSPTLHDARSEGRARS